MGKPQLLKVIMYVTVETVARADVVAVTSKNTSQWA